MKMAIIIAMILNKFGRIRQGISKCSMEFINMKVEVSRILLMDEMADNLIMSNAIRKMTRLN